MLYACFDRGIGITNFRLLKFLKFPLEMIMSRGQGIRGSCANDAKRLDHKFTLKKCGNRFKDVSYILHPDDHEHLHFDATHWSNVDKTEGEDILDEFIESMEMCTLRDDAKHNSGGGKCLIPKEHQRQKTNPFAEYDGEWLTHQFHPYGTFREIPQGGWTDCGIFRTFQFCKNRK
jgi:hypothetical protein